MNSPNFQVTSAGGSEPCSFSAGNPDIPYVAPGFGNHSIRLGEPQVAGYGAEKASFSFLVSPADTDFIYMYALVIQDAGHPVSDQPYVSLCIQDQSGNPIPCGCFRYTGGPNLPGFFLAQCDNATYYKPWSIVGVDLAAYIGQVVTVNIENVDCNQGAHYAYSYWDFTCGTLLNDGGYYCDGQQAEFCVPPDPSNSYLYEWYQNGQLYNGPGNTSGCITPYPQPGDTFSVKISPPGGCSFELVYVPEQFILNAEFRDSVHCGKAFFENTSSNNVSELGIDSWQWSFPTGIPNSSSAQSPMNINFGAGQHTASLVISKNQCYDTVRHTFTIDPLPKAQFSTITSCEGSPSQFSNSSFSPTRDPVVSQMWYFPDGSPRSSTAYEPSSTFSQHGYTDVTLVISTANGCIDSISRSVLIHELPVVAFTPPVIACAPFNWQIGNLTTTSMDTVDHWLWSFPGGEPANSTSMIPPPISYPGPGVYGVNLFAVTRNGCISEHYSGNHLKVLPSPVADFSVKDVELTLDNPVTSFTQLSSADSWFWEWDFGDGSSDSIHKNPKHDYSGSATFNTFYDYDVKLKVSNYHGCKDSIMKKIRVSPVSRFHVPNAFTPNGDNVNDRFFAKCLGVKKYSISVYDRWGRLVWNCFKEGDNTVSDAFMEGLSSECQWDGKVYFDGHSAQGDHPSQSDVFVYKAYYTDIFDKSHEVIGDVTIIY
ncbi:MAG: PKD domain-containing protein [Bacteroidota bacterium]